MCTFSSIIYFSQLLFEGHIFATAAKPIHRHAISQLTAVIEGPRFQSCLGHGTIYLHIHTQQKDFDITTPYDSHT